MVGDTLGHGREDREKVALEVIPALCRAIRWFDSYGVRNIMLYDSEGCLKTPWATKSLQKGLQEDGSGQQIEGMKCTIKLLCEQDWHDCISEFTTKCGNEGTKAKAKGTSFSFLFFSFLVRERECVCAKEDLLHS